MQNDSEYLLINALAHELHELHDSKVEGTLFLMTERIPCGSCTRVLGGFLADFPSIRLEVFYMTDYVNETTRWSHVEFFNAITPHIPRLTKVARTKDIEMLGVKSDTRTKLLHPRVLDPLTPRFGPEGVKVYPANSIGAPHLTAMFPVSTGPGSLRSYLSRSEAKSSATAQVDAAHSPPDHDTQSGPGPQSSKSSR